MIYNMNPYIHIYNHHHHYNFVYISFYLQFSYILLDIHLFLSNDIHLINQNNKNVCIFHYNLTSIHPFSEGNERLGLYWQTLLLAQWRPILAGLPFESVVTERQEEYRRVLSYFGENAKITHFIEFILRCLLDTIVKEVKNKVENKVKNKSRGKVQDKTPENAFTDDAEAQLSKSEQRIVKLLVADPRITIGALSRRLQLSEAGINKVLAALRKRGIIERVGANKNGSWKVNL
jgi:Fic family protein